MSNYDRNKLHRYLRQHRKSFFGGFEETALRGSFFMTMTQALNAAGPVLDKRHIAASMVTTERALETKELIRMLDSLKVKTDIDSSTMDELVNTDLTTVEFSGRQNTWNSGKIYNCIKEYSQLPRQSAQTKFIELISEMYDPENSQEPLFYVGMVNVTMLTSVVIHEDSSRYKDSEKFWIRDLSNLACTEFMLLCHLLRPEDLSK